MRIGIDTHFISSTQATGNRTYTAELVRSLINMNVKDEYFLYMCGTHPFYDQFMTNPRVHLRPGLSKNGALRNFVSLPYLTSLDRLDVLHLHFFMPWMIGVPTLLSIHDLYYAQSPAPSAYERILSRLTIASARRANHIATLSEYSKKDIIKFCQISEDRISVIPLAADRRFSPLADHQKLDFLKTKYGIDRDYLLFVGRTEDPRKNLPTLIDAFLTVSKTAQLQEQLVIAGRHGTPTTILINKVKLVNREKDILFPGVIDDDDLPSLLAGAKVFIYVSNFEGFGLPVLEAMACGVPVITSNTTSLPEVAGNAAIKVTPGSIYELAAAITRILKDSALQNQLRYAGMERVKLYSWEQSAHLTYKIYTNLAIRS